MINKKERGLLDRPNESALKKESEEVRFSLLPCSLSCKFAGGREGEIDPLQVPNLPPLALPWLAGTDCVARRVVICPADRPTESRKERRRRRGGDGLNPESVLGRL